MALEGERRAELLSTYLDGELSALEAKQLKEQLSADSSLRADLDELRQQQQSLRAHFTESSSISSGPGAEFTRRVLEAAVKAARDQDSQETPSQEAPKPAAPTGTGLGSSTNEGSLRWMMLPAAVAASLMLVAAIFSSGLLGQPDMNLAQHAGSTAEAVADFPALVADNPSPDSLSPMDQLDNALASQDEPKFVSDLKFGGLNYVLVVDVVITDEALRNGVLERLLAREQVPVEAPIVLDAQTAQEIQELRMNVQEDGSMDGVLYFLRAGINQLANVLDTIYADEVNYPGLAFDIAVDSPQVTLMQNVANATGERFTANKSFAAPISVATGDQDGSVISNLRRPKLISTEQREGGMEELLEPNFDGLPTSVLLIVHRNY